MSIAEPPMSQLDPSTARSVQAATVPTSMKDARMLWSLKWFTGLVCVCTSAGVLLYCYDHTLASIHRELVWLHVYTGDVAILAFIIYLVKHIGRVWGFRQSRALSWWSGLLGGVIWTVASITGVWGQFGEFERFTLVWWIHAIASLAVLVALGFHAAYGFRARFDLRKEV